MDRIFLESCDYFIIVRSLVFAEHKKLRKVSDTLGQELQLTPDSRLDGDPFAFEDGELERVAERVGGFFNLSADVAAALAALDTLGSWADHLLEHAGPRPERITFYTSGSTGEPKPIVREYFFLEQDALLLAGMLTGTERVVGLVPPHHIYGFIYTVLIPKVLGAALEDKRFSRPAQVITALRTGDCVVGFPTVWKKCAETSERFPAGVVGVTSTGPCPPEVIRTLKRQGLGLMIEIYGSSESGAMGYRMSPDDPLTLMATWKRHGEDRFVRDLEAGGQSEPFEFQDVLEWVDETRFKVSKRTDSAVQVSGINVYPARTREVLLAHEAVAECAVRLMRPEEGQRLKAFVVPAPNAEAGPELLDRLRVHMAGKLYRVEQPESITFGPELPRNEMGKLADWSIAEKGAAMNLEEALARLEAEQHAVEPEQRFTVDTLQGMDDAWGVARLFYAVHGGSFPFETYYIPTRLLEENRLGLVHSAVARTPAGDIVGYGSLFRSSAPHHGVYEIGSHVVHPDYRESGVALALQEYIRDSLIPDHGVEVYFSEAPCHQVRTQKFAAMTGLKETAVEIGLMPASAYGIDGPDEDRVSMLLLFGQASDETRRIHVPAAYDEAMEQIMEGLGLERLVLDAGDTPPESIATRISSEYFDFAQVARLHVLTMGKDFERTLAAFEDQARASGARVLQVFVNLGQSWCAGGVDALRERGYFLGGLLPRWFDDDGLLMQQVLDMPREDSVKLFSQQAHRIQDLVRRDIESNPACTSLVRTAARTRPPRDPRFRAAELTEVVIAGRELTVDEVVAAARHARPVSLTSERAVLARVDASASFIEWAVRTGEPIYGVNTGFGGMADVTIPEADLKPLQNNLVRFMTVCVGDHLPLEDVRAAMLLRANSHLKGASGVRRELLDRMVLFLNRGVTPLVRSMGSIGASGDLAPLASIAGCLIGADPCYKVDMNGETVDCVTALERLGLEPLTLGPKEGLGMINGTSVMTGIAANSLYDVRRCLALSLAFHAMTIQALRGSNQSFHPYIQQLKPHPGQILAAELMLDLLDGSGMCRNELDGHHEVVEGEPAQDRYSLRCLPQFVGPVLDGLRQSVSSIETEINSANDNPLIDPENCLSLHTGNFLGQYVAVAMDHLRYCVGLAAKHMDAQIAMLVAPEFNSGLRASLVGNPERKVNMGLKGLQIAGNSVMPLLSYYGAPIADRFPTHAEQFNQNINSQGFNAAVLARKSADALQTYMAIALIFGVQAVSLRAQRMSGSCDPRPLLSPATLPVYEAVVETFGFTPSENRPLIFDDDEQSLEEMVERLTGDIRADGATVASVGRLVAMLRG